LPLRPPDPYPNEPLRKYSIQNLQNYDFQLSEIKLERVMEKKQEYTSYLFSYKTLGKRMTGQVHIPNGPEDREYPVIIMVRGYVPPEEFTTGAGTRWQAAEFAKAGYVTIAPDFLGFGGSAPAGPGWEERFEKPVNVIELIKSVRKHRYFEFKKVAFRINPKKIGIWAHSNGGQITLASLEALGESIPATLWAPVTAPFPYSVLFYSKEMDDGGSGLRSAVAGFESVYNVQEYSLTQYMNRLRGPLQLHQGSLDDAVPQKWSDEFVQLILKENVRRKTQLAQIQAEIEAAEAAARAAAQPPSPVATVSGTPVAVATRSASVAPVASQAAQPAKILADAPSTPITEISTSIKVQDVFLQPIDISYFVYNTGDHGMFPNREEAIARDLAFFERSLKDL
jgi:dienelactone hydrolase